MSGYKGSQKVTLWDLEAPPPPAVTAAAESHVLSPDGVKEDSPESIIGDDNRVKIDSADFGPGGKYRSIVKLQMQYENQPNGDTRWAMGTGWLVAPDVLVTAGHCVYMWKDGWGRVKKINAYIGYSGKDSLKAPNVQARRGIRAVTTEGYLAGPQHRVNDVGFLKLDKPFQGVTPFQFANTPIKDKLTLGVIGYPADKYDPITNERGSHMWGEYAPVDYDLKLGNQTDMLQYKLSTYPGQSGSPVLVQGQNISVGVHVYGGPGDNAGSPIGSPLGNPFEIYLGALGLRTKAVALEKSSHVTFHSPNNDDLGSSSLLSHRDKTSSHSGEESFFTTLGSVAGMFGGPVGALAGVALKAAGALVGAESALDEPDHSGSVERSVLSEAALKTVLSMDVSRAKQLGVFDQMQRHYHEGPQISQELATQLLTPVAKRSLRITNEHAHRASNTITQPHGAVTATRKAFTDATHGILCGHDHDGDIKGEESFMGIVGSIGSFVHKGWNFGKPVIASMVKQGLVTLSSRIPEADMGADEHDEDLHRLSQRAAMGEAALKTLATLPEQTLHEEGFFGDVFGTIKSIGGTVAKYAPGVINTVGTIVKTLGSESALESSWNGNRSGFLRDQGYPTLTKKRSVMDSLASQRPSSRRTSGIALHYIRADDLSGGPVILRAAPVGIPQTTRALSSRDSNQDLPAMGLPPPQPLD